MGVKKLSFNFVAEFLCIVSLLVLSEGVGVDTLLLDTVYFVIHDEDD